MRLHNLFESTTPESLTEDIIDIELTEDFAIEGKILEFTEDGGAIIELDDQAQELVDLDEETLNEFIPLAIGAVAAGVTAYDAYKNYKQYKAGKITKGELAKRIGVDAALGMATGGAAKLIGKGAKAVKNFVKSKKAPTVDPQVKATIPVAKAADEVPVKAKAKSNAKGKGKGKGKTGKALGRLGRSGMYTGGAGAYDDPLQKAIGNFSFESEEFVDEAEYQGRKVKLGKPMAGDVKKFKVYVKNPKGNVVKVNFGQKGVKIKKNNPARRKSFRARHNCSNPGPRHKARYWSCRKW
jgi:hypothetical protein